MHTSHSVRGAPRKTRAARGLPGAPTAVQERHRPVPHIAQHPPEPRRHRPPRVIVSHDLPRIVDTEPPQGRLQGLAGGQRVASSGNDRWSAEVAVEVCVDRPRDVAVAIGPPPCFEIG
jgi:hypothetical protein